MDAATYVLAKKHTTVMAHDTNILNLSKVVTGHYLPSNGNAPIALATAMYSDYMPVIAGELYEMYATDNAGNPMSAPGVFYKNDKTYLSGIPGQSAITNTMIAPANAAYVRINIGTNHGPDAYFMRKRKSRWFGKKLAILGDSIPYGYSLASPVKDNFGVMISKKLGFSTLYQYSSSGTRIAKVTDGDGSYTQRYSDMDATADVILVLGGSNDYGHSLSLNANASAPFGTFADRTDISFYGGLHVLFSGLMAKYVGKKIVILTPLRRVAVIGASGDDYVVQPETSKNLKDYVDAIKEVAEFYGLPVCDLFSTLGILNPNIAAIKTLYVPDGLHPNLGGHNIIASAVSAFLETL